MEVIRKQELGFRRRAPISAILGQSYTQRNLFDILLNQPDIRLYLPFSDWFGTQTDVSVCVPNQSKNGNYNLISGWFNKISRISHCPKNRKGKMFELAVQISADLLPRNSAHFTQVTTPSNPVIGVTYGAGAYSAIYCQMLPLCSLKAYTAI